MSAASARDAAAMAKRMALTVVKILFAQIVMEKEGFDIMTLGDIIRMEAKVKEQAAEIEKLRAVLTYIRETCYDDHITRKAHEALGETK